MSYLILASILFAASFGLISRHLAGVDPTFVACVRLAFAAALFLPFLRGSSIGSLRLGARLVGVGGVQFGLMYVLYQQAYGSLQGHEIALFTTLTPLHVVLLDGALRRRLDGNALLAAVIAIAAALVLSWRRPDAAAFGLGFLLVQAANLCFAAGQVLYRRWIGPGSPHREVFSLLYVGGVVVAGAVLVLRTLASETGADMAFARTAAEWGVLAYLGLVPAGMGFYLWNVGATRVSTATLSAMNNLKAPLGAVIALLFFGEEANYALLTASSGLIALSLFVASRGQAETQGKGVAQQGLRDRPD